jgi:hypothetical protein
MDFVTHLPMTKSGHDGFFLISCKNCKRIHTSKHKSTDTAEDVANDFVDRYYPIHGIPKRVISDRDSRFTGRFWTQVFKRLGTILRPTTSHHPQGDGQSEIDNQTVIRVLRGLANYALDNWDELLPIAEFAINDTIHEATNKTRFEMDLGYSPDSPLSTISLTQDRETESYRNAAAQVLMKKLTETDAVVRELIIESQVEMKFQYDKHHRDLKFKRGDKVLLSTKHLSGYQNKLAQRWVGPLVVKVVEPFDTYELILPKKMSRLHPRFHVSKLKPFLGPAPEQRHVERPLAIDEEEEEWEVEFIVDHRPRNRNELEFKVRWKGYPPSDDSWEPEGNLANSKAAIKEYWKTRPTAHQHFALVSFDNDPAGH